MSPLLVDFFDVGQGDGILVRFPKDNQTMLVDLGSTKNKKIVKDSIWKFLQQHTKFATPGQTLEWLVLTHGDSDHYNLVLEFLNDFKVNLQSVYHGGLAADYGTFLTNLKSRTNPNGSKASVYTGPVVGTSALAGDFGCNVDILAAGVESGGGAGYVKNSRSVVLRLRYKGRTVMLTGDATVATEIAIVNHFKQHGDPKKELPSDALKVAHHGSHRTSNHATWLGYVNPRFAFISSDRSGSLDEDQKPTGHRLPQALTVSLIQKYCPNVIGSATEHPIVSSYQLSDFETYNAGPDISGEKIPYPVGLPTDWWWNPSITAGVFTTLVKVGLNADADEGVQWQYRVSDTGDQDVFRTD